MVGMWRTTCSVAMSCMAALSIAPEALCSDDASSKSYVAVRPPGLALFPGLEFGQRTTAKEAQGYELDVSAGFNTGESLVLQAFLGAMTKKWSGESSFIKCSYGVVGVAPFFSESKEIQLGAGAVFTLGNEWEWSNGFLFGVEWAGIGGSVSLNRNTKSATLTPRLLSGYVGWLL